MQNSGPIFQNDLVAELECWWKPSLKAVLLNHFFPVKPPCRN